MPTLAERQLAAWQQIARDWPVSLEAEYGGPDDRTHWCGDCGKGVALAYDSNGTRYQYTEDQWLALVVLHLRNHHPDLDPDT